jgi:transcriptional regulator with XRE-family HTH domain
VHRPAGGIRVVHISISWREVGIVILGTMSRPRPPNRRIPQRGTERARDVTTEFIGAVKGLRLDYGYSKRQLADAAGIAHSTYGELEAGRAKPSVEVMGRLAAALGGRLGLYLQQGTGPVLRDHFQAAIIEALGALLDARWQQALEVNVYKPVRGTIDVVLDDRHAWLAIAGEAHSELRRLEQQVRWANAKADALERTRVDDGYPVTVSRLPLLRSTPSTRQVAAIYRNVLAAFYPARHEDAVASLTGAAPWPGSAIVWFEVTKGVARLLETPPDRTRAGRGRARRA